MQNNAITHLVNKLANDIDFEYCYYLIAAESTFFTAKLFTVKNKTSSHHDDSPNIWDKYSQEIQSKLGDSGIILVYLNKGNVDYKIYKHYNKDVYTPYMFDLILKQEFDIEPESETDKKELAKSIKNEKIKTTLVYACHLNNTEKILTMASNASNTQLNKSYNAVTPLGYCAINDNLPAFMAVLNAGADLSKTTAMKETALRHAFRHSPDIVMYIRDNYPEQFSCEIEKLGFAIAFHTTKPSLLQLILDAGADVNCHKASHPPLHSFADYNNLAGLAFLLENGADINTLNRAKQTVLERIENSDRVEAIALLQKYSTINVNK